MYQGGSSIANDPSTPNGINVDTGASSITIAAENDQTSGILTNKINNESSSGANIKNNQKGGDLCK